MVLIIIENQELLLKLIKIFENANIKYTTNVNDDYDFFLVAELNKRILKRIKENIFIKKIIFVAYLEEFKIEKYYKSSSKKAMAYKEFLISVLKDCYMIVVSLPFFKDILSKIFKLKIKVIEKENPLILKFNYKRNKNSCLIIDHNYKSIKQVNLIAMLHPKINFVLYGYVPNYLLTIEQIKIINNLSNNVELIKYYNNSYIDFLNKFDFVIMVDNELVNFDNLLLLILLKRKILVKYSYIYANYFINSKNIYLYYNSKDLVLKANKILDNKVLNLNKEAYLLIKNNNFNKICREFYNIFK